MHVHLVGVAGTGMGALAGLLRAAGHRVTGSDTAFHPPMGEALTRWGVETMTGWDPAHLEPRPDLVVVGNVCRKDNPEARAAIDGGIRYDSLPGTIESMFLTNRPSYVVAGTHGKTTTTALLAFLLHASGADPGFLVGGVPRDFDEAFRIGATNAPFVIEGDEYDSAFFEKSPKLWRYRPFAAILTSIEHDHIDIYPDIDSYRAAFDGFVESDPARRAARRVRGRSRGAARCRACALPRRLLRARRRRHDGRRPLWLGASVAAQGGASPFDLFVGGSAVGRVLSPMTGEHNRRNAIAAIALAAEAAGVPVHELVHHLAAFRGVRRRQELLGVADGVSVYEDFAHHPTAVRETLIGMRARHPEGALVAVFEPRSATASRRIHQDAYASAFLAADVTLLAPVGRPEIEAGERLDVAAVAERIRSEGRRAEAAASIDAIVERLHATTRPGDTIVIMSNGAFGGIYDRVLVSLTGQSMENRRRR